MAKFDVFEMECSLKNIPISNKEEYMMKLIEKTRSFIRRLRIKAYFFEKDPEEAQEESDYRKDTFGLPSRFNPKASANLINFENDLIKAISNIKFHNSMDNFQRELLNVVNRIRKSPNVIVKADKTSNLYEMTKEEYLKLLNTSVTKSYKKAKPSTVNKINEEAVSIAKDLQLCDRIKALPLKEAFITLKDHKENFNNNPKCRLLNPTKSEIGLVSKQILERINR